MISAETCKMYYFKEPVDSQVDVKPKSIFEEFEETSEKKITGKGAYILCRSCLHIITTPENRIAVQGSHLHTFANPAGIVYEIGCFRSAKGCGYTGPITDEFTWFRGFRWNMAVCGSCLAHLGWRFISAGSSFNGLIIKRLMESP